jgi:FkbM family methyltransferase
MYSLIKRYLARYPVVARVRRAVSYAKYEFKDIRDSYLSRASRPKLTPYGFSLSGSSSVHHLAMQEGSFEPEETKLFKEFIAECDIFVDVGANIGFYACMARHAGKHVIAVEPLARNLEFLYKNMMINGWDDIEVFPLGLNERPGMATLYGASSTGASLIDSWAGASRVFQRTISISTLDILLGSRFSGKKIIIKVDVEGMEYPVLCGAQAVMQQRPRPNWIVEICLNEYHPDGINRHYLDTFNLFWQYGYEAYTADDKRKLISRNDVKQWEINGYCDSGTINYLFVDTDKI